MLHDLERQRCVSDLNKMCNKKWKLHHGVRYVVEMNK